MRRQWKREFRQQGVQVTRRMVEISAYYSDERKMEAARRWLRWQDNRLTVIRSAVAAIVVLVAAGIPFLLAKLWP